MVVEEEEGGQLFHYGEKGRTVREWEVKGKRGR